MTKPKGEWLQSEQRAFVVKLAMTGNVALAAVVAGRSVDAAYRRREAVPQFAADWDRAMAAAWDKVEAKVLAELLGGGRKAKTSAPIDYRIVLAILERRNRGNTPRSRPAKADPQRVSALRNELLRLAAPLPEGR